MNGLKSFGTCRDRSGAIGVGPLIVVVAVLAGAAIAIVVAVRAAAPASDKPVVAGTASVESAQENPLRSSDSSSLPAPVAHEPSVKTTSVLCKPAWLRLRLIAPPERRAPEDTKPSTGLPPAAAATGKHPLDPAIDVQRRKCWTTSASM